MFFTKKVICPLIYPVRVCSDVIKSWIRGDSWLFFKTNLTKKFASWDKIDMTRIIRPESGSNIEESMEMTVIVEWIWMFKQKNYNLLMTCPQILSTLLNGSDYFDYFNEMWCVDWLKSATRFTLEDGCLITLLI